MDYFNNKVIVDLVEAPHSGVLAILDEACLNVGKVTDKASHTFQLSKNSVLIPDALLFFRCFWMPLVINYEVTNISQVEKLVTAPVLQLHQLCFHAILHSKVNPADKTIGFENFRISHYAGQVLYKVDGFLDKNKDTLFQDFKRLLYNSRNPLISSMWPEGAKSVTNVTKRPVTAGTDFKTSIIKLVGNLATKVKFKNH